MAEPRRKEEMETTEAYRGELRPIRNVERFSEPANNKPRKPRTPQTGGRSGPVNASLRHTPIGRLGQASPKLQKSVAVLNAISASWAIVAGSAILYPVQFVMAALTLGGLAALVALDTSWFGYADVFGWFSDLGQELMFISLVINFAIGFLTFLVAIFIYLFRGVSFNRGISIIVAAVCLSLYAAPFLNFVPWMWLWCLYVVKSQTDDQ